MKRILAVVAACSALAAWGQNEPLFTSQCISKNETGFKWEKNWWVSRDFRPGVIFMARKIDHSEKAFDGKDLFDTPQNCKDIEDRIYDFGFFDNGNKVRYACYTVKEHGNAGSLFLNAEKCLELYDKSGKLKEVQCKQMRFSPDGLFIRLPWEESMDLNPYPENSYKDSLNLSVGTCSRIN